MRLIYYLFFYAFFILFSLISCKQEDTLTPAVKDLRQPWTTSSVAQAGIDVIALDRAVAQAEAMPRFLSLLVIKEGELVFERYFHGNHRDSLNDVRSITKSVISTLIGIALEKGFINSLDETLSDYLHPAVAQIPADKQQISIRDLLTMSAGLEWDELSSDSYSRWIRSGRHLDYMLELPVVSEPGESFTYNSGAVHLLSILLEAATGMEVEAFAEQYFFNEIGIRKAKWEDLSDGYVNGGAGLDLRPRDLARLGQFYLQQGRNGTTQILSPAWIEAATTPKFPIPWTYGTLESLSYGYLWWIEADQADDAYLAWGYGGQFVYVVPSLDLVVVTTTNWRRLSQDGGPKPLTETALAIISEIVAASR